VTKTNSIILYILFYLSLIDFHIDISVVIHSIHCAPKPFTDKRGQLSCP